MANSQKNQYKNSLRLVKKTPKQQNNPKKPKNKQNQKNPPSKPPKQN